MVDILMTTYNSEKYIREQIDSILNQTAASWQLYIRDDCSSDDTLKILEKYAFENPGKISIIKAESNSGRADKNFFELLKCAQHQYIMFCDHDDVWENNKIEMVQRKMMECEETYGNIPIAVHSDAKVVSEELKVISESLFSYQNLNKNGDKLNDLLVQNIVTGCTMMINKTLADKVKTPPENDIMHDWWFALIAVCFGVIAFVDEPLVLYRQHFDNEVGAKNSQSISYNVNRLKDKNLAKKVIQDTYIQAEEFFNTYKDGLSGKQKEIILAYANMKSMSKLDKIKTAFKYKFFKYGIKRKLGQLLYM